jgi:hypothetical protein
MDTLPWIDQSEWEIGRRAAGAVAKVIGDPRVHVEEVLPVKLQTAKSTPSETISDDHMKTERSAREDAAQ